MSKDTMKTYLIEPKAPLIIRTGRPFDDQSGADEARFPPPSTLAGALRTAFADSQGQAYGPYLADIPVAGPLPVILDAKGEPSALLVPKPADAHYFWGEHEGKKVKLLVRSAPLALMDGEGCDLPQQDLLPIQLLDKVKGKAAAGPRWWAFDDLMAWRDPVNTSLNFERISQNGWIPPADDIRTHVAITAKTQAAESGKLFQTAGLNFWQRAEPEQNGAAAFPAAGIGLMGCIAGDIKAGVITLGGERRLAAIKEQNDLWPQVPANLSEALVKAGGLCLTLLTPVLFAEGWRPGWLNEQLEGEPPACPGLRLKLRAAALERWQPHSGWDLAKQQPRAGRKLIPAGATYWFEILTAGNNRLDALWLASLCDHAQDRRDGFGLALPQPWSPLLNPKQATY